MGFFSYLSKTIEPRALTFTKDDDRGSDFSTMSGSDDDMSNGGSQVGPTPKNNGGVMNLSASGGVNESSAGTSGSELDRTYLERELEKVRREKQELIDREQAVLMARENGQAMSRVFGRMPQYQGQDQINYGPVNKLAKEMFVEMKHLSENWSVQSDDKSSLYQRILRCNGVTVPEGWDRYAYFKKVLARVFAPKYRSMRTNYITFCREAYLGKCERMVAVCYKYYAHIVRLIMPDDAENGVGRRLKIFSVLIGGDKSTFTKVLKRADENLPGGRETWEEITLCFYHFVMDYVVGLYSKASDLLLSNIRVGRLELCS